MESRLIFEIFFGVMGGLGLFLLGMKFMSEGMQAVAGDRLRSLINSITGNRFVACGVGTAVTGIIQSSSVTTVMVVGMVNAGLLSLSQAIGVILGADIGTTVTAWIVSLPIARYGLPLLGFSALFYLFSTNERLRFSAMMCTGLGMVFFGLQLMKEGMDPLSESKMVIDALSKFNPESYVGVLKCVLVGSFVTAIVQSSSATVAITITLATTNVITYDTAVALVLGENIGTTITAWLASLGSTRNARRAAYAHISIKVLGVMWIIPLFFVYVSALKSLFNLEACRHVFYFLEPGATPNSEISIGFRIAMAHTFFNIMNVAIFLFFVPYLAQALLWLMPDKACPESPHLAFLDVRMLDSPAIGIEQSKKEVLRMGQSVKTMLQRLRPCLAETDEHVPFIKEIFEREEILDVIQKEITEFITKLLSGNVASDVVEEGRNQLRMADEYESISDYVRDLLKLHLKMRKGDEKLSERSLKTLLELHDQIAAYVEAINKAVEEEDKEILRSARVTSEALHHAVKSYRSQYLDRVGSEQATATKCLIVTDMFSAYRRIKEHAFNIAEVVAGEK